MAALVRCLKPYRRHASTLARRHRNDLDRQEKVGNQPLDHQQLLVILLAKERHIGRDGGEELGDDGRHTAEEMRSIESELRYRGIGGKEGKAWIVNEAHGLRVDQVRKLLTLLEPERGLPEWCAFVFTTTVEGQAALFEGCDDASPPVEPLFAP